MTALETVFCMAKASVCIKQKITVDRKKHLG